MNDYIIIIFVMLFSITSCSKNVDLYEPNKYNFNTDEYFDGIDLTKEFTVCSCPFTKKIDILYKVNLLCSKIKKKPVFIAQKYFYSCYLFKPIASSYVCK